MAKQQAIQDDNLFPALIGHTGTAGTADTVRLVANSAGALTVSGASAGTVVEIEKGTITTGTIAQIGTVLGIGGTVNVAGASSGTVVEINKGTINVLAAGTITTGTVAVTTGTIVGPSGTNVALVGNPIVVAGLANGTGVIRPFNLNTNYILAVRVEGFQDSNAADFDINNPLYTRPSTGTLALLTTVSNLTNGSINVLTGTIQSSGTTTGVGVVSNLTNGSINVLTGTVTSVTNLADGTVHIDNLPVRLGTPFSTYGTTGAAVWGTIIAAAGAGTKQYIENLDIVVHSGTVDVAVTNIGVGGSTGAGVLARGQFPPGGGIQRSFFPSVASGTNGTLSYWLGGAGTASIDIVYWQGV